MAPTSARAGYGTLPHNVTSQGAPNYAQPYAQQQQQQQQQDFYNYAQPQGHYAQPQQVSLNLKCILFMWSYQFLFSINLDTAPASIN